MFVQSSSSSHSSFTERSSRSTTRFFTSEDCFRIEGNNVFLKDRELPERKISTVDTFRILLVAFRNASADLFAVQGSVEDIQDEMTQELHSQLESLKQRKAIELFNNFPEAKIPAIVQIGNGHFSCSPTKLRGSRLRVFRPACEKAATCLRVAPCTVIAMLHQYMEQDDSRPRDKRRKRLEGGALCS